ncbi:Clavaminate synthase-like protein [Bimuria novae-zelandiae CBS 107.79]|uniref:Clavaminate synthase-like protein n=1 Tax=Bimuria novae-zelandiae CBS 107.79 TaxID=1447943 RepID=A0A6A5UW02_9PLEO|nr:Clavaminate synthase-like protein [Bimuria novae-zelandiae CBS 107.79]
MALNARSISYSTRFTPVKRFDDALHDLKSSDLSEPTVFPKRFTNLPAISKWFTRLDCPSDHGTHYSPDLLYLGRHGSLMVPLEVTRYHAVEAFGAKTEMRTSSFEHIEAPLSLLLSSIMSEDDSQKLYLAQYSLDDLPSELRNDLPVPELVTRIWRGDIYASSLWMGRPPTSTPLHRDPNPNLFVQLVGKKVIRLMTPRQGRALYEILRTSKGHAHMRGEEMMVGEERDRLQKAVWNEEKLDGVAVGGFEATLEGGDGLYIPLGWWHAVQSYGALANASVNWWFR